MLGKMRFHVGVKKKLGSFVRGVLLRESYRDCVPSQYVGDYVRRYMTGFLFHGKNVSLSGQVQTSSHRFILSRAVVGLEAGHGKLYQYPAL